MHLCMSSLTSLRVAPLCANCPSCASYPFTPPMLLAGCPVQLVYKSSVTGAESHMYRFRADRGLTWPMALEKYKKEVRACLEETTAARKL